jgi:glyoxylase-like metal-dependent hydrolase (beta-lactamase superfamily II)
MGTATSMQGFHDPETGTVSYVVHDRATRRAAVIDPVLDYDSKSGHTATRSADRLLAHVAEHALQVDWILETHAHADHLSAAPYVRERTGGRIGIGECIREVQSTFAALFNFEPGFAADGSQFDHLFADGETFRIGEVDARALFVPGHTPADTAYLIDGAAFIGDTLFMPDVGSARADFPGGDARRLYRSIRRLLALPEDTALCVCHDYPPKTRGAAWQSSVAEQKRNNVHVHDGIGEDEFVAMREARDKTLGAPALILPALQVNVRGGRLPQADGQRHRLPAHSAERASGRRAVSAMPTIGASPAVPA